MYSIATLIDVPCLIKFGAYIRYVFLVFVDLSRQDHWFHRLQPGYQPFSVAKYMVNIRANDLSFPYS